MPRWWPNFLDKAHLRNVVLDPVIQPSAGGPDLLDAGGVKYLGEELMKRASVVTPNIAEAALLSGMEIKDVAGMEAAARKLVERGARAVVVKGGHMDKAVDVLFDGAEASRCSAAITSRRKTRTAPAARLLRRSPRNSPCGRPLREAAMLAKAYVTKAIENGFAIGKGPGPLDHFYRTHHEPPPRGIHEVPQHGMHPASEPATR